MTLASLISNMSESTKSGVYTMTIGEIIELDPVYNRAAKVMLIDESKESKYNDLDDDFIYNIPFTGFNNEDFVLLPPYKVGDKVTVLFSHRDIDNILENDGSEQDGSNFNKSDAVIIGGLNLFDNPIDQEDVKEGDILFKKRDNSLKIRIEHETNDISIETDGNIYLGNKDESQPMPLGRDLKDWLDNHTHSGQGAGTPTSPSPELSKGVHNS